MTNTDLQDAWCLSKDSFVLLGLLDGRSSLPRVAHYNHPNQDRGPTSPLGKKFCLPVLITAQAEQTRGDMPILKAPPKQLKNATIQVRVEESIKLNLESYSRFIGANPAYVVSEALRLLFRKDGEFKQWLDERAHSGGDADVAATLHPAFKKNHPVEL